MKLEKSLRKGITDGFRELFGVTLEPEEVKLQPTVKDYEGSITFVTFPYLKQTRKPPEETGKLLGEYLKKNIEEVQDFNAVKGFLNLVIYDSAWVSMLSDEIMSPDFAQFEKKSGTVMVEYSSPNTNKPLHLGHLRNNFLGFSVAEILKAYGLNVIKANLINDRGIHICKSMVAYQKYGNGESPGDVSEKGDHFVGKYYVMFDNIYKSQIAELENEGRSRDEAEKEAPIMREAQEMLKKWEEDDTEVRELWQKMNNWVYEGFEETYKVTGVDFDKNYYESDTYLLGKEVIREGLDKKIFYKKDNGSVWVDLKDEGLDEKLLLRADGTSVYITQDIGTAELKYKEYQPQRSLYVVGNEQEYHFKVLKVILNKLGRPYADGIIHFSYGMVDLPEGKMKSREGTVVDADDLVREMKETAEKHTIDLGKIEDFSEKELNELYMKLGLGALKFFLLKVDPRKRMLFDPKESIEFHGFTGPFIQYTHARICAVLRKADTIGKEYSADIYSPVDTLHNSEREVLLLLKDYPGQVKDAAENYSPSVIAQYCYDLAKEYNRFYAEVPILAEKDEQLVALRLALSDAVADVLRKGMKLLGIELPERM